MFPVGDTNVRGARLPIVLLKTTVSEWLEDKAARLAAALSYYTVLALPPILLIVVAVVGLVWGRQGVEDAIVSQASGLIGQEAGTLVADMIGGAFQNQGAGIAATILGVGALLFSATGAFGQLQESLNTIWEVQAKPQDGIMNMIKNSSAASAYGAAGALVLLLLWIYYTAQILFFGAEFTQTYARLFGSRIQPAEDALPLTEESRANQGIPHQEAAGTVTAARGTAPFQSAPPAARFDPGPPALPPPPASGLSALKGLIPGVLGFAAGMLAGVVARSRDEDQ